MMTKSILKANRGNPSSYQWNYLAFTRRPNDNILTIFSLFEIIENVLVCNFPTRIKFEMDIHFTFVETNPFEIQ